jgi:hypothetical protein
VAQLSDRRDIASPKTVSEVRVGGTVQFRDKRGELHTIVVDAMLGALVTGRELQRSGSPGLTRWHLHLSFLTKGH